MNEVCYFTSAIACIFCFYCCCNCATIIISHVLLRALCIYTRISIVVLIVVAVRTRIRCRPSLFVIINSHFKVVDVAKGKWRCCKCIKTIDSSIGKSRSNKRRKINA